MGIFSKLSRLLHTTTTPQQQYATPREKDTSLAIQELNQALHAEADAIEIYLALASLYRVQGNIDKALRIHARLLAKNGLPQHIKSRLYAELGIDYKRAGFFDRACNAFQQSQELGFNDTYCNFERYDLYITIRDYNAAAILAKKMRFPLLEAFATIHGIDSSTPFSQDDIHAIHRALAICPNFAMGWTYKLLSVLNDSSTAIRFAFARMLSNTDVPFVVLEDILRSPQFAGIHLTYKKAIVTNIIEVIQENTHDFLLYYYAGRYAMATEDMSLALQCFRASYELNTTFWCTRYALLNLSLPQPFPSTETLEHITFFSDVVEHIDRFVCSTCNLSLNTPFHMCPRCKHVQTIQFRVSLFEGR